jgi:Domain of unknown function (DUF4190)
LQATAASGRPSPSACPPNVAYPRPGEVSTIIQPVTPVERTNGLAIASLVLGILWIYWIGSVLALVFGYVAKSQIEHSDGFQGGRGMAIAGIVLGWVGVGVLVVLLLFGGLSGSVSYR